MRQIKNKYGNFLALIGGLTLMLALAGLSFALPGGPSVSYINNYTSSNTAPTLVNNASHVGGVIAIANLNVTQQVTSWKAYVGNVSGKLALRDADDYSIYDWSFATLAGEVYATRSSSVTWSSVECASEAQVAQEMAEMNHTEDFTAIDSINDTFDDDANDHDGFYAGAVNITANECNYSANLYVSSAAQAGTDYFEEVLLYDGSANLIYTSILESDQGSYHTGVNYDYQILIPEKGEPGFSGVTSYYFYVELG